MRYRWFLVIALLSVTSSIATAQKLKIPKYYYDTAYIINYNNHLAVRLISPQRLYNFGIKNTLNGEKYSYRPNLSTGFGVGFTYKWLAIDLSFSPNFTSRNNEKFGYTNEFNVAASAYLERTVIDFHFRRYKGMYDVNPEKYLPDWDNSMPRPQRPDLLSVAIGLDYSIPFNWKRYSLRTTMLLDGMLKRSSGSIMTISGLYYYHASADSSMLPTGYEYAFPDEARITNMNFLLLSQAMGYAYTFVVKKFYFTLSAFPAISFNTGKAKSEVGNFGVKPVSFKFISKEGIGYNSERWYAGFFFIYDINDVSLDNELRFSNNVGGWKIFVGYRIKPPKVVQKYID
jgi:hypothetical protein